MFELEPFALPADYGEGIVSLAAIKEHCSIDADEDEFDDQLSALRDAAVDMVERYCGVYLAVREGVVWRGEVLPPRLRLGVGPVVSIDEAAYLDSAGAEAAWDVAQLRTGIGNELLLKVGQSWPVGSGFAVTFTAGYADDTRPAALVTAVKRFTAYLFANREGLEASGSIEGDIPIGVKVLCNPFKPVVL